MHDRTDHSARKRLDPARYDAIHRALLAGLLSNIGQKTDAHEYTGARGIKFNIFPGSSLFKTKPNWVVAGELVETTRLYARTVASIRVEWIERAAEHLVKRTHSDPHWNRITGHVVAYEKVTLYGLAIVPRRSVHYGGIEPKNAREIFIRCALVDGDCDLSAPFFRHNQRLVDEIRTLEAKSRQRGLLVDDQTRFDFYDARIPAGIHNLPAFEKWRRQIEGENPRFLHMSRRDLMNQTSAQSTEESFPDTIPVAGLTLPLAYHFEPGHIADGVTVSIPLAALNQVPAERFEWLVPGLLREKITALIKSLPKPLRVQFIPAPDFADAATGKLSVGEGSLLDALGAFLGKASGTPVRRGDFDPQTLLDHLHMNFSVVDETGKVLACGRDIHELRRRLGVEVRQRFDAIPQGQFNRDGITSWDFGDLPESIDVARQGIVLKAYPALTDNPDTPAAVSLRLFDTPSAADHAMRSGLRKLFILQLGERIRDLQRNLPNSERMCLNYVTIGTCDDLKRDLVSAAVDRALFENDQLIRTRDEFIQRAQRGWNHLSQAAMELAGICDEILVLYQETHLSLGGRFPALLSDAIADMKQQLSQLVPPGFVLSTPRGWLEHVPRFIRAIQIRLKKLTNAGLTRDNQAAQVVRPLWLRFDQRSQLHRRFGVRDPNLAEFRWMMEELRVSLFAQELKTSIPISVQRLEKQWSKVRHDRSWDAKA
jgi:ATP-dependent helicase HrpA